MARQESFASLVTRLRALRQPVIAAVNGPANGAGLGWRWPPRSASPAGRRRSMPRSCKVGMSSCDIGVSWLLPRCVGMSRAFEIMLTGRMVDAAEAERIGLVSETVDDERPAAARSRWRAASPPNSAFGVWMTKRGGWANVESASLQAAIELENRTQIPARTTGELAEGRRGAAGAARSSAGLVHERAGDDERTHRRAAVRTSAGEGLDPGACCSGLGNTWEIWKPVAPMRSAGAPSRRSP